MRWVLDTSTVASAVRSEFGASRQLTESALRREFDLLLSLQLSLEYEDVLFRSSHLAVPGVTRRRIELLFVALMDVALEVVLKEYNGPWSSDPGDNHVLRLAVSGHADAIVTHNLRHFTVPCRELGVDLYTPGQALRFLRSK
jgi:predicted nucleic acid-binding protein